MKRKSTILFMLLMWLNVLGSGGRLPAQSQLINQFPYFNSFETESEQEGWSFSENTLRTDSPITDYGSPFSGDGTYYISLVGYEDGLTSPLLDLSSLERPFLSFMFQTWTSIDVSYDGKKFQTLVNARNSDRYKRYVELPRNVVQLRFRNERNAYTPRNREGAVDAIKIFEGKYEPMVSFPIYQDFSDSNTFWNWDLGLYSIIKESGIDLGDELGTLITPDLNLSQLKKPKIVVRQSTGVTLSAYAGGTFNELVNFPSGNYANYSCYLDKEITKIKFSRLNHRVHLVSVRICDAWHEVINNYPYSVCPAQDLKERDAWLEGLYSAVSPEIDLSSLENPKLTIDGTDGDILISSDSINFQKVGTANEKTNVLLPRTARYIKLNSVPSLFQLSDYASGTVTAFPYHLDSSDANALDAWLINGASFDKEYESDKYVLNLKGTVISPEFDLSSLKNPKYMILANNDWATGLTVWASKDGIHFEQFDSFKLGGRIDGFLDKEIKFLKLEATNDLFVIKDFKVYDSPVGVISEYPCWNSFTSEEVAKGWYMNGVERNISQTSGVYVNTGGCVISPLLNFSSLFYPRVSLVASTGNYKIYTSVDGRDYVELTLLEQNDGLFTFSVPKETTKIKIEAVASGNITGIRFSDLNKQGITEFPYIEDFETEDYLDSWTSYGVERMVGTGYSGKYYLDLKNNKHYIISPQFDFSTLKEPKLFFMGLDSVNVYTSTDKEKFVLLKKAGPYEYLLIDKSVKWLKFEATSSYNHIDAIRIVDSYPASVILYPYTESFENDDFVFNNWELNKARIYKTDDYDGKQAIELQPEGNIISPVFDLTGLRKPMCTILSSQTVKLYISVDGKTYALLNELPVSYSGMAVSATAELPKNTKRIKLEAVNTTSLDMFRVFEGLSEPVCTFPYSNGFETEDALDGWIVENACRDKKSAIEGVYGLKFGCQTKYSSAITPCINLSGLKSPKLSLKNKGGYICISVSSDSVNYVRMDSIGNTSGNTSSFLLSTDTKWLKFESTSATSYNACLDAFKIEDESAPITALPFFESFETDESTNRWVLSNAYPYNITHAGSDGNRMLTMEPKATVISPLFDFSAAENNLIFSISSVWNTPIDIYTSTDAINYTLYSIVTSSPFSSILPKNVKRIKLNYTETSLAAYIDGFSIRESNASGEINYFPYIPDFGKPEEKEAWMVGGAVEFEEGQISIPSRGYAITPKLDLTGLKQPRLVLYNAQRSYLYIQSSKDGINFTPLDTCFNELGTYMVELPSDAVRLKFLSGDIKDLQIYDAYREPISGFPYIESFETKESLYNWTIEGGVNRILRTQDNGERRYGDYYLSACSPRTVVTSPMLDLSSMQEPCLSFWRGYGNTSLEYSEDGHHFIALTPPSLGNGVSIPNTTKFVRFILSENANIDELIIYENRPVKGGYLPKEDVFIAQSGAIGWEYVDGAYTLKRVNQTDSTGVASLYWFTDVGRSGLVSKALQYTITGFDEKKATLYVNSSTYGQDGNGSSISLKNGTFYKHYSSEADMAYTEIKVVLKPGVNMAELPDIRISNLLVGAYELRLIETNRLTAPSNYYDIDGDGSMEFAIPRSSPNVIMINKITPDGGVYEYRDIQLPEDVYIIEDDYRLAMLNVNNDEKPDFIFEYRKKSIEGQHFRGVYKSMPDGTYHLDNIYSKYPCDYDSDGRTDFVAVGPDYSYVNRQLPDGSYAMIKLDVRTSEEWDTLEKDLPYVAQGSSGSRGLIVGGVSDFGMLGGGWVVSDVTTIPLQNIDGGIEIDYNKDGLTDMLIDGALYLNLGNNCFKTITSGGILRDLNNDLLDDIIYVNDGAVKVAIVQPDGSMKEQTIIEGMEFDNRVFAVDFDKDGDVDLIIPFSYSNKNAYSILLVCENDGKGNFTIHENFYEEQYKFFDCADIDGDGYYDILAGTYYKEQNPDLFMLKGDNLFKFNKGESFASLDLKRDYDDYSLMLKDIDGDGKLEIVTSRSQIIQLDDWVALENVMPQKMDKPVLVFDSSSGILKVNWNKGKHEKFSSEDLTYALRIGSAPGMRDMYYAYADRQGKRENLLQGNMGYNLCKTLDVNSWKQGTYYVAVQAVDPMGKGSEWSDEVTFENSILNSSFSISISENTLMSYTTQDTVMVCYDGTIVPTVVYDWDFDGATIDSVSVDKSKYWIHWLTAGEKTVSLQVRNSSFVSPICEQTVRVFPIKSERILVDFDSEKNFIDINGNGRLDMFLYDRWSHHGGDGFYQNDGNGNFTKIAKLYNMNVGYKIAKVFDFNNDGYPDVENSTEAFINDQKGGFVKKPGHTSSYFGEWIGDWNHDGYHDLEYDNSIYANAGDNVTFADTRISVARNFRIDLNKDGYVDLLYPYLETVDGNRGVECKINHGNFHFETIFIPFTVPIGEYSSFSYVADIDNDGYYDLVLKDGGNIKIYWNNQNRVFDRVTDIKMPEDYSVLRISDYDNNGRLDFIMHNNGVKAGIAYFYSETEYHWYEVNEDKAYAKYGTLIPDLNGDGIPESTSDNYLSSLKTFVTNTPPECPTGIRAFQTDTTVVIEWNAANDKETPACQMRYNLSVKKKGATGDNSFVISPMNGLKDEAAIVPGYDYIEATRYEIPVSAMPVGEYEIQLQSIDLWQAHSPMSAPLNFAVTFKPLIEKTTVCEGVVATIKYIGVKPSSPLTWNWDGGQLIADNGDYTYDVLWNTPGTKTIEATIDGATFPIAILVNAKPDTRFNLPEWTLTNTPVVLNKPETNLNKGYTYTYEVKVTGEEEWKTPGNYGVEVVTDDKKVSMLFSEAGTYEVRQSISELCNTVTSESRIEILKLPKPEITKVTVDNKTGKNRIEWEFGELPPCVKSIRIYKEGVRLNRFNLLSSVQPSEKQYVDMESNPQISSSCYYLTFDTEMGETEHGTPHRSILLIINKGGGANVWNLMWSKYEGANIETYRILRGTTPENLAVIGEVAGSAVAYVDAKAPDGTCYYALEFNIAPMTRQQRRIRAKAVGQVQDAAYSNVISTGEATQVVYAEELVVKMTDGEKLTSEQPSLKFSAIVYPVTATYRNVSWSIVKGEELATITPNGLLTATGEGSGTVTVRVSTVDGSDMGDTKEIPVDLDLYVKKGFEYTLTRDVLGNVYAEPEGCVKNEIPVHVNKSVSITHMFTAGRQWKAVSFPYDVASVVREDTGEELYPTGEGEGNFWLRTFDNEKNVFVNVTEIRKNKGYIMAVPGVEDKDENLVNVPIRFVSYEDDVIFIPTTEATVGVPPASGYTMHGNPILNEFKSDTPFYRLSTDGMIFERVAGGSYLSPYESYILASPDQRAAYLRMSDLTTDIAVNRIIGLNVWGGKAKVCIVSGKQADVAIYTVDGILQKRFTTKDEYTEVALPTGIYIVNRQKVVVK